MFTVDVIVAVALLALSAAVIVTQLPDHRTQYYIDNKGYDIVNVLSHTQTTDLCLNLTNTTCSCPGYEDLQSIVCSQNIRDRTTNILSLYSEGLYAGTINDSQYNRSVHEIFVEHNIIDAKRFGFSLIATEPGASDPIELYNTVDT